VTLEKVKDWNQSQFGQRAPKVEKKIIVRRDEIERPTRERLIELLDQYTHTDLIKRLHISKDRLRGWIEQYNLSGTKKVAQRPDMAASERGSLSSMRWIQRPMSDRNTGQVIEINGYRWSGSWRTI
jgi:hypothetical protein